MKKLLIVLAVLLTITGCAKKAEEPVQEAPKVEEEPLVGGWEDQNYQSLTPEIIEVFKEAVEKVDDADYTPVCLVATQVVSGINYKVLCHQKTVSETPTYKQVVLTIYKGIDKGAEITEVEDFNPESADAHHQFVTEYNNNNVFYTDYTAQDGKTSALCIYYAFDENGKLASIVNVHNYDSSDDAKNAYETLKAEVEAYKDAILENNAILCDMSSSMIKDWGEDITRDELVSALNESVVSE